MKKTSVLFVLGLSIGASATGCSEDDEPSPGAAGGSAGSAGATRQSAGGVGGVSVGLGGASGGTTRSMVGGAGGALSGMTGGAGAAATGGAGGGSALATGGAGGGSALATGGGPPEQGGATTTASSAGDVGGAAGASSGTLATGGSLGVAGFSGIGGGAGTAGAAGAAGTAGFACAPGRSNPPTCDVWKWDDFESYVTDPLPSGWALVWADWNDQAAVAAEIAGLDRRELMLYSLGHDNGDGSRTYWQVAIKNTEIVAKDVELLWRNHASALYSRFAVRGQGDSYLGHSAYLLEIWDWYNYDSNQPDKRILRLDIIRVLDSKSNPYDAWDRLKTVTCENCASSGTSLWVRFRANGSSLKAKAWPDGQAEPSDWTIETTDTTISQAGWFGPVSFTNYGSLTGEIAWATDGGTATFSAP